MSDDRPKKTWKEIDSGRDRSGGSNRRKDQFESERDRVSKSAAYGKYKSQLDKLFTPGAGGAELPESLKAKLAPASEEGKQKKQVVDDLRSRKDAASLTVYLATGLPLPDDARLLMALLDLDDDALVKPVLERLLDLVEGGTRPNRMLLIGKLDALTERFGDGEAVDVAKTLRAALD